MAKISTYIKDENLHRSDTVLASEVDSQDTINIPLSAMTLFVNQGLFNGFGDGNILANYNGDITETFIKSGAQVAVIAGEAYLTTENNLFIPTGHSSYGILEVGSRVVLTTGVADSRGVGIVASIDEQNNSVRFSNNIPDASNFADGMLNVRAVVLTATVVTVTGDLLVTGAISGTGLLQRLYVTGAEYNALSVADTLQLNVEYAITDDTV